MGTIHASFASTRVIVMGMLPRGTDYWDGGASKTSWPNALTPAIDALNAELQVRAAGRRHQTWLCPPQHVTLGAGLS